MPRPHNKSNKNDRDHGERIGDYVSIRKRGRLWHANWQEHNRQHRRSLKTSSKKEALTRAWKIEREIEERAQGLITPLEPASIAEVIQAYDEYLISESRAPKTLAKYRLVMRRVQQLADQRHIDTIDQLDMTFWDAYRAVRKREGAAEKTRYNESIIVRQLVRFAISRRMVDRDPMAGGGLRLAKPPYKPQPCWTRDEAERIVAAAHEPFATAFAILLDTGLRSGELSHLTKADIDFAANVLHVRPKRDWSPKTGDARAVPMTPRVNALLRKLTRGLRGDDWVLSAQVSADHPEAGRRLTERRLLAALKRVTKRLDLPGHVHTFRHTFVSVALMQGVPEAVVRKWVGHIDPAILQYYTHVHDTTGQAEMLRLANVSQKQDPSESDGARSTSR